MTNPTDTPVRFVPGGPPKIRRTRLVQEREGMIALLDAGALEPGDELIWAERDHRHVAVVRADGRVLVNGRVCDSPSEAGELVGNRRPSGWDVWICSRDGESLAYKRARIGLDPR